MSTMSIALGERENGSFTERKSRKRKFTEPDDNGDDNGISYDWVQPVTVSGKLTLLQVLELVSSKFTDPVHIFRTIRDNALSSRLVPRIPRETLSRDEEYPGELVNALNIDQTLVLNTPARKHVYYVAGVAARNTTAAYTKWFLLDEPNVDIAVGDADAVPLKRGCVFYGFPDNDDSDDDVPVDALRDAFIGRLFWYSGNSHFAHSRPTLFVYKRQYVSTTMTVEMLRSVGVKKKRARRMVKDSKGDE